MADVMRAWEQIISHYSEILANPRKAWEARTFYARAMLDLIPAIKASPQLTRLRPFTSMDTLCLSIVELQLCAGVVLENMEASRYRVYTFRFNTAYEEFESKVVEFSKIVDTLEEFSPNGHLNR